MTGPEVVLVEVPVDAAGVRRGRGGKTLPDKRAPYAADADITPRVPMHKYTDRPLARWAILRANHAKPG